MQTETEHAGLTFPGIRWAAFSLVFFGIPLILVWLGYNNIWRDLEAKEQRQLDERLEKVVTGFDQFGGTDAFVERLFRLLAARVFSGSQDAAKVFALYRRQLHRRFPGLFEFTFIDRHGEPLPELCDRPPPVAVLRRLAAAMKAKTLMDDNSKLVSQWRLFQSFIGSMMQPEQIKFGALRMASHKEDRHFVIMSGWYKGGMLIAHANFSPNWESIAVLDRAAYFNRHSRQLKSLVVDETKEWRSRANVQGADLSEIEKALAAFKAAPRAVMKMGDTVWAHTVIGPTVKVLVWSPRRAVPKHASKKIQVSVLLVSVFLLLSIPTWMVMSGRWIPYISIRWKLVGLFLYMVGLPLAFMSLVASDYLGEKRVVLEKQVHDEMEKSLLLFDRRMPMIIGEIERLIKSVLGPMIPAGAAPRETMIARMRKFREMTGLDAGFLVNENCDIDYIDGASGFIDSRNRKLLKPIYANLFRQYNREDSMDDVRESQVFKIGAAGGIDVEALYADIASSLGRVIQFNFTGRRSIQIMLPVMDAAGRVRFLLSTGWQRGRVEDRYLKKYMIATCRQLEDTRWIAVEKSNSQVIVPASFKRLPQISAFSARVRSQGQTVRDSMDLYGNRYLLTGIPGQELSNIDLIAITSDRFIRTEIGRLQWMVGIVSLAILLTGATVGTLLARKFLEPISNLAAGVASLRRREFEKRLPILDRDELGDLSQTFNEMMEGMADLEVARIVQESLFPTKSISAPPFGIHGTCVSATQAGGDYYDFFPMPDGKLMLLVGDVSGHGVGAAMVMAMAKALVAHMVTQSIDPAAILGSLNTTLLKVLNRRRMMSCFIAFLDG
ncbi:MAG TPA: SpoIIE family protein phosphatase, partial [Candidatus Ozemobacteraceae bacterium]|nr:SpoIIE family protein phosphatase [Candidatus Ozemobacteraceae bacterium]